MTFPNLNEEKKLWHKGYVFVAGVDEAGRGPLAGPVVAAAVVINPKFQIQNTKQYQNNKSKKLKNFNCLDFDNLDLFRISSFGLRTLLKQIKDSKQLSPQKREYLYKVLIKSPAIQWGIGIVSEKVIDKINVKNAAELAMEKAIKRLSHPPDFLIIDGNHLSNYQLLTTNYKLIIKADEKVFSCAAASILAKVTRDRIMRQYNKKYPQYGFKIHKGYPTKSHLEALKKYGPCRIHRKSFAPVKKYQISNIKY